MIGTCIHNTKTGGPKCGEEATHVRYLPSGRGLLWCAEHAPSDAHVVARKAEKLTEGDVEFIGPNPHPHTCAPGQMGKAMLARQKRMRMVADLRGFSGGELLEALRGRL